MADLKFEDSEFPANVSNRPANPHIDMVKDMVQKNSSKRVVLPYKTDKDKADVKSLISYVQAAGREIGVTVNKRVEELTGKESGKVAVYFKTRARITRSSLASTSAT